MRLMETMSRHVAYPLWDIKDRSCRLSEYRKLLQSQYEPIETRRKCQVANTQTMLEHAYRTVPFYREHWDIDPVSNPLTSLADLENYPVVTKEEVRNNLQRMISTDFDRADLRTAKTGGSTGTALKLYFDKVCQEKRNAAGMMSDTWAGWRPGMQVAGLWGTPPIATTARAKLRNRFHDRIFYLDTMNLSAETMGAFNRKIIAQRPGGLFGHAHSIYEFARYLRDSDSVVPRFDAIVATSMMLLDSHRKLIESVFDMKVSNRYGCEEVGLVASECSEHAGLHINEEHVMVEFLSDSDQRAGPGEPARLVVTDLVNYGMPLIRYEVGDVAEKMGGECACGRTSGRIQKIVGRTADYLKRVDGSLVSGISMVEKTLTAIPGIQQMQIVQNELKLFTVVVVPDSKSDHDWEPGLIKAVTQAFGESCVVTIVQVEQLPRTKRGKSLFSICNI